MTTMEDIFLHEIHNKIMKIKFCNMAQTSEKLGSKSKQILLEEILPHFIWILVEDTNKSIYS